MNEMESYQMLDYLTILDQLAGYAHSQRVREQLLALRPLHHLAAIAERSRLTGQAKAMLKEGAPPLTTAVGLEEALPLLQLDAALTPKQLTAMAAFLQACRRMQLYLKRMEDVSPEMAGWGLSLDPMADVTSEIERCIRGEAVDERASAALRNIRRRRDALDARIRGKLDALLRGHPEYFMEQYVAQRSGRMVLPVKKEYRKAVAGAVVDASASGSTLFIEPATVGALRDEMSLNDIEERNEVARILQELTALLAGRLEALRRNRACLERLDFYFALGQLALDQRAQPARVEDRHLIRFEKGRHPLLPKGVCVPVDFFVGASPAEIGVVITGPNTGGKTVTLKTVGLLCLMAQTGLHVPCQDGVFPPLTHVLCDLGDGQSIPQNLSTFSAHVARWVEILRLASPDTLVLLDELGAGTDPQEGMGLAVAMLEALAQRGSLVLATTHYPEIKTFAQNTSGFLNASMAFDPATLSPLYRLQLGRAGQSCALLIAQRLGLPKEVLARAAQACGGALPGAAAGAGGQAGPSDAGALAATNAQAADGASPARTPGAPAVSAAGADGTDGAAGAAPARAEAPGAPLPTAAAGAADGTGSPLVALPSAPPAPATPAPTPKQAGFAPGDSVYVHPLRRAGIVAEAANAKGEVLVVVAGKRMAVNQKRLSPFVPREQLYPDDYDLSIALDSVANRKARHRQQKRHDPNAVVVVDPGKPQI